MTATQRVFVSGRVQNIGYRNWVIRKAHALGVTGWVRNCSDGRVELLLAGEDVAADAMIEALHEGPPLARVDTVVAAADDERPPKGFTKRFTA